LLEATEVSTTAPPAGLVYRVGYGEEPFSPVPWHVVRRRDAQLAEAHDDQTLGGRFDDPAGRVGIAEARRFRTIYCASERVTALAELIIQFRGRIEATDEEPAQERPAALQEIIRQNPELQRAVDRVPGDWLARRSIGAAVLDPALTFVNLAHQDTLRYLHRHLGGVAAQLGIRRIDHGALLGANREFTQTIAGHFYEQLDPKTDEPRFAGIRYVSSLGLNWECWAAFDQRFCAELDAVESIESEDSDLEEAARILGLNIGSS